MARERFTALDSWRGIAALMVTLVHLRVYSHVGDLALVRNADLFVDFFFVLSGFIIAATYEERLAAGFGVGRFMLLRFGRVYPLHFVMLLAFALAGGSSTYERWHAVLAHLLLIHGLGVLDPQIWGNFPSWSISSEFFAYLAFAAAIAALRGRIGWLLVAVVLSFPLLLYSTGDISTNGYEWVRCLYGFAAGVIVWRLFRRFRNRAPRGTLAEAAAIMAVVLFVSAARLGPWSVAAPFVFAAVVLVFASETGAGSRMLTGRAFVFLGTVSYSIYMVHFFVAHRMFDALMLGRSHGVGVAGRVGSERWAGDVVLLLYLLAVVALAAATYRFIERPARDWFRRLAAAPATAVASEASPSR